MNEPKLCYNGKIKLLLLWMNQLWSPIHESPIHELNIFALTAWLHPNGRNGFKELSCVYDLSHIDHINKLYIIQYLIIIITLVRTIWGIQYLDHLEYLHGGRAINKAINKQHASCLPPVSPPWKKEIVQEMVDTDVLARGYALVRENSLIDVCASVLFVYLLHVFILSVEFVVCLFPNKGTLHQKMIVAWLLKLTLAAL